MYPYSEEHRKFLKKVLFEKRLVIFSRLFIIIFFLLLWEFLADYSIINSFLFSSPSRIVTTLLNLFNNDLFIHVFYTIFEVIISFFLATSISFCIAMLLWSNNLLFRIFDPYIVIINSLPKVAIGPLIIIWFGASLNSIIFMSITIILFNSIINIYSGFISVNKNYVLMLKSFGANKFQIFRKVILPCSLDNIIFTFKVNASMSLIGVIMGELLVSKKGLGYLIMYGSQVFNLDLVITSIFILGVISYFIYVIIDYFEKYIKKRKNSF